MSSNMVTLIHKQSNMSGVCHVWMTGVGVAALVSISGAKKRKCCDSHNSVWMWHSVEYSVQAVDILLDAHRGPM